MIEAEIIDRWVTTTVPVSGLETSRASVAGAAGLVSGDITFAESGAVVDPIVVTIKVVDQASLDAIEASGYTVLWSNPL